MREILTAEFPGVEVLQYPGGLVASVFANGYTAPLVVEVHDDNLAQLDEEAQGGRRRRADGPRHPRRARVAADRLPRDPRRHRPREGGLRRDDRARGRADDARRDARQHQRRPGVWIDSNNGQSYYVVTFYDGARVADTQALGALPVRIS